MSVATVFLPKEQIQNADFVLMVGTETYHKRVHKKEEPDKGFGICWEANLIYNLLYQAKLENTKFIPVIFDKKDQQYNTASRLYLLPSP
jgi:hypothetical protein